MNYLLQDAPKYQMVEQSQPNVILGIAVIILGIFILCQLVIAIMRMIKKLRDRSENSN